jgi:hypothetical protein
MIIHQAHSGKEYRERIDIDDISIASANSFHSIEDDYESDGNPSTQDYMILSNCIVNLSIEYSGLKG